jgi:hypothetical protein
VNIKLTFEPRKCLDKSQRDIPQSLLFMSDDITLFGDDPTMGNLPHDHGWIDSSEPHGRYIVHFQLR